MAGGHEKKSERKKGGFFLNFDVSESCLKLTLAMAESSSSFEDEEEEEDEGIMAVVVEDGETSIGNHKVFPLPPDADAEPPSYDTAMAQEKAQRGLIGTLLLKTSHVFGMHPFKAPMVCDGDVCQRRRYAYIRGGTWGSHKAHMSSYCRIEPKKLDSVRFPSPFYTAPSCSLIRFAQNM